MNQSISEPTGTQLAAIEQLLTRINSGDLEPIDLITTDPALHTVGKQINQLMATMKSQQRIITEAEERGTELLDAMMSIAAQDYSKRIPIREQDTIFGALAAGLNMLVDELEAFLAERERLQEEIIQSQAAVIQELSTPMIPINDDILVMPLIGSIDSARAQHLLQRLLTGVAESHARTVIMDITGVMVVDTQVANTLLQAAQAVQLLGTKMILTGIRPEVAQTLVNLGVELRGLDTWSTLQMGITQALRQYQGASKQTILYR